MNLYWSGGWDSTFWLLKVLWTTDHLITAYYVEPIHKPREKNELEAISTILDVLKTKYRDKFDRITFKYLPRPKKSPHLDPNYCQDLKKIRSSIGESKVTYVPQLDLFIHYARTIPIDHPAYCVEVPFVPRVGCRDEIFQFVDKTTFLLSNQCDPKWYPLRVVSIACFIISCHFPHKSRHVLRSQTSRIFRHFKQMPDMFFTVLRRFQDVWILFSMQRGYSSSRIKVPSKHLKLLM
jgi:hypothetical protein